VPGESFELGTACFRPWGLTQRSVIAEHHGRRPSSALQTCVVKLGDLVQAGLESHTVPDNRLVPLQLPSPSRLPARATCHTAGACQACILVAHSSSAGGVVGLARHQDRTLAREVSAMSAGRNASVLVWGRLSMDCRRLGSARFRSSGCAPGHARGGAAGIARSRSWLRCLVYEMRREYKLTVRDSRRRRREYYPRCATEHTDWDAVSTSWKPPCA
jgi:hypothetical protein